MKCIWVPLKLFQRADDLLFETKLKIDCCLNQEFTVTTIQLMFNGNVYVMGTASNFDEKAKLENFLREMKI